MTVSTLLAKERATGYPCPQCGKPGRCTDSRPSENGWRRRRGCPSEHRWTTYEVVLEPVQDTSQAILEAKRLMANATSELIKLDILLSKMADRADILRELNMTRYGGAGPRG